MKIQLGENYIVKTDGLNAVMLKKCIVTKKAEEGEEPQTEEVFKPIGYYANLKQALSYVLNVELLEDEVIETVEDLIARIDKYTDLVANLNI